MLFLSFVLSDTRPPNDHDDFYTAASAEAFGELDAAAMPQEFSVLAQHFSPGDLHSRGPQTLLLASLDLFGASRVVFRTVAPGEASAVK